MGQLALALWACLVSAELAGGSTTPAPNLTCFQCFKVSSWTRCLPVVCQATARVCISNEVTLTTKTRSRVQISKGCAVRCPNSNSDFEWFPGPEVQGSIIRRCCSGHLCNLAPVTREGLRAQPLALLQVGLGLLWALL